MGNGLRKERRSKKRVVEIAFQGPRGVGKSALGIRFAQNHFVKGYDPSIDDYHLKRVILLADEQPLFFEIPDPREGQSLVLERMLRDEIILGAKGFFFVYSITSPESFDEIETFIQRVERVKDCSIEGIGILIGNKVDLEKDRQVPKYKGEELAKRYQIPFFETSAKTGENVEEIFQALGSLIIYGDPFYQFDGCKNIKSAKR